MCGRGAEGGEDRAEEDVREKIWRKTEAQDRHLWKTRLLQSNADLSLGKGKVKASDTND